MSKIVSLSGITGDSGGAAAKNPPASIGDAEDVGSIPGLGSKSTGVGCHCLLPFFQLVGYEMACCDQMEDWVKN